MRQVLVARRRTEVDYAAFNSSPEDRAGLLFSMVALAKRDGSVHLAERLFIKQIAQQLGFIDKDVDAAFDPQMPSPDASPTPVPIAWGTKARVVDPQFGIDVDLEVVGQVTVLGVWREAEEWIACQSARLAVDGLARSTTSLVLAWTQTDDLAYSLQGQLDELLRPHQMHLLSVDSIDVRLAPDSMAALQTASRQ